MTVEIQQQGLQILIDVISYLIPFAVIIAVSYMLIALFKSFVRGGRL